MSDYSLHTDWYQRCQELEAENAKLKSELDERRHITNDLMETIERLLALLKVNDGSGVLYETLRNSSAYAIMEGE